MKFRSTISYTEDQGIQGCCCRVTEGGDQISSPTTWNACVALNGYFNPQTDEDFDCSLFECPDNGAKGCCCSCSYMSESEKVDWLDDQDKPNSGTKDGVTPCECTQLGGTWSKLDCETYGEGIPAIGSQLLCFNGGAAPGDPQDVRWPHACCVYDLETGTISCKNTCNADECNALNTDTSSSIYYDDGSVCGFVGPNGEPPRFCSQDGFVNNNSDGDGVQRSTGGHGGVDPERSSSCIFKDNVNGIMNCGLYTKSSCDILDGYFVGFDRDENVIPCGTYPALTNTDNVGPDTITSSELNNYSVGDDFNNLGIYCGVFNTGKLGEGSSIEYTENFSGPTNPMHSTTKGRGSKEDRWAIILHNFDLGLGNYGSKKNSRETSTSSGKYNIYNNMLSGSVASNIKDYVFNGVGGWTIPSIQEQGFIQKNLLDQRDIYFDILTRNLMNETYEKQQFVIPNRRTYLSSTVVKLGNLYFVQAYNFVSNEEFGLPAWVGGKNIPTEGGRIRDGGTYPSIVLSDLDFQELCIRPIKILKVID